MKGYLIISWKNKSEVFPCLISQDTIKPCKRLSWFSFRGREIRQWTGPRGIETEEIKPYLRPEGHIFFKKNLSIKKLAKILSNHPFLECPQVEENQIKILTT